MFRLGAATAALVGSVYAQNSSSLPTVDLGYQVYRASGFNVRCLVIPIGSVAGDFFFLTFLSLLGNRQLLQLFEYSICCASCW